VVLREVLLEPQHALGVEVVGGLVEEEQVGLLQEQLAERDAALLTTGEVGDRRVGRRAAERIHRLLELGVEVPGVGGVDGFLQRSHLGEQCVEVGVGLGHRSSEISLNRSTFVLDLAEALLHVLEHGLRLVEHGLLHEDADVKPGVSFASPLLGVSRPAMILRIVDFPAPLGPTMPIFAPGRNAIVTSSRMSLSPTALRARTIE
jgi:hypothetical protein